MLEMTLKPINRADKNVRVKRKRDPKSKQSKTKHLKNKERVESLLVVFVFCLFLQVKNEWKETLKEFAQAIFMMRKKKITGSQEVWAFPAILAASA